MTAIITEKFRQHNANQFSESFSEASPNTYYLFLGKAMPFTSGTSGGTDTSPPTPADSVSGEFYLWDSMLGAKKISSSDTSFAIPRVNWANSTVFDMYDDIVSSSNTTASGAKLTIAGELASTSNIGVASFNSGNFTVSSGDVTVTTIDGGSF